MLQSLQPYISSNRCRTTRFHQKLIVCDTTSVCFPHYWQELGQEHPNRYSIFGLCQSAFDMVNHNILFAKLKSYGVGGNFLKWFTDYLLGRVQRVVVYGVASEWAAVTSGFPQEVLIPHKQHYMLMILNFTRTYAVLVAVKAYNNL